MHIDLHAVVYLALAFAYVEAALQSVLERKRHSAFREIFIACLYGSIAQYRNSAQSTSNVLTSVKWTLNTWSEKRWPAGRRNSASLCAGSEKLRRSVCAKWPR